jgi:uncharacterized protein (DUF433 family)
VSDVVREHVEIVQGESGPKARIAGHRIRVQDVAIWHEKLGMSADEIVDQFPTITLSDVYAALAYYWDHRDEIEQAIADEHAFVEEFRRGYIGPLQEKLERQRRSESR